MAGPFGGVVEAAAELLAAARARKVATAFTTVAYEKDETEGVLMLRKTPRVRILTKGSRWTELDPRLARRVDELLIIKRHASAFFETPLEEWLVERNVDTLLLCGCITSGCVRSTAVDAAQRGIRPLVVREAVGDRYRYAHEAALKTVDDLYGDVISLEAATTYLRALNSN